MFVVKDEYDNIKKLTKVKFTVARKGILFFCFAATVVFLASLTSTIYGIMNQEVSAQFHDVADFSVTFFYVLILVLFVLMRNYRPGNENLSMFPQTNTSRFISSQIINYTLVLCVGYVSLVMYLLYSGAIKILSTLTDNIHVVPGFDIGFVHVGFFIFIAYGFLGVAVIDIVGVILRKWTYYAGSAFIALLILALINSNTVAIYTPRILDFLIGEPSIGLFMIKSVVLWLILVGISFFINRSTIYHKSPHPLNKKNVIAIGLIFSMVLLISIPLSTLSDANSSLYSRGYGYELQVDPLETRIDISHIPNGGRISLSVGNTDVTTEEPYVWLDKMDQPFYIYGMEALEYLQGDTIVLKFYLPFHHVGGVMLEEYILPQTTAYMDGNKLCIDYDYVIQKYHLIVLPIWSIARQFESFKDKGLILSPSPYGISYFSGNINISVE